MHSNNITEKWKREGERKKEEEANRVSSVTKGKKRRQGE